MNMILFGPPGIGKSTLISRIKADGGKAIDLEDIYPSAVRFTLPKSKGLDGVVFGGADLDPKLDYGPNVIKVLLVASQAHYEQRRKARDARVPGKESQAEHLISDWLVDKDKFDYVVWTDLPNRNVADVKRTIAKLLLKGRRGGGHAG